MCAPNGCRRHIKCAGCKCPATARLVCHAFRDTLRSHMDVPRGITLYRAIVALYVGTPRNSLKFWNVGKNSPRTDVGARIGSTASRASRRTQAKRAVKALLGIGPRPDWIRGQKCGRIVIFPGLTGFDFLVAPDSQKRARAAGDSYVAAIGGHGGQHRTLPGWNARTNS